MRMPIFRKAVPDIIFHFVFILAISVLVILPSVIKNSPVFPDYFYTRPHGLMADYYYYLAIIKQGATQLFETNPYSTEPASASQIHLYYILLGRIGSILKISGINMYYIGIYISLIIYYIYSYLLCSLIFKNRFKWLAMFIIFFCGPFPGWTFKLFGHDIYLGTSWWTQSDPYSRITSVPHHFFPSALLVGSVYYLLRFIKDNVFKYAVFCAMSLAVGTIFYGVPGLVFFTAFSVSLLLDRFRKTRINIFAKKNLWGIILISLSFIVPAGLVYFQLTSLGLPWSKNLYWEYTAFRAENFPIVIGVYLANFGLIIPYALLSIIFLIRRFRFNEYFILFMFLAPFLLWILVVNGILQICKIRLIYTSPYVFGGILATLGIMFLYQMIKSNLIKILILVIIFASLLVNSGLSLYTYWKPNLKPDNFFGNVYIHKSYIQALNYLDKTVKPQSTVFSDFFMGMLIPSFSNTRVYIGHEVGTLDFDNKLDWTEHFYGGEMNSKIAQIILADANIDYVFWDKCYYMNFPKEYEAIMSVYYQNDCVSIYKIP
jgi:hypothetical protein